MISKVTWTIAYKNIYMLLSQSKMYVSFIAKCTFQMRGVGWELKDQVGMKKREVVREKIWEETAKIKSNLKGSIET